MRLFISLVIVLSTLAVTAQTLFIPRDIQQAYKNKTRSPDGKPGPGYWQNHARYKITVTCTPPSRNIQGTETIVYTNNSTDTLRKLTVKLFLNIHKPGAPRDFGADDDYLTSGMHIDAVTENGQPARWNNRPGTFTVTTLPLQQSLLPGQSVNIGFNWHYDISKQSGREGMLDSTSFFLAYFYPRIAVYDDYNGWDNTEHTESREFYSDFNDYDVTLRVPKNFVVWGTGTLQQPEKVLQPEALQRYQQSWLSDTTINIATRQDVAAHKVTLQNEMNEWRFTCSDIPDVAFGLSDTYVWDGASTLVDKAAGRRASAQAAYNDTAQDYHYVAGYAAHALNWFSHNWPGIAYPYEKTTIFQGQADMEYPMMANNSTFGDTVFSRFVAEHEIAHTYFPFYMGINETRYGSMDEGWATALEYLIGINDLGAKRADGFFKRFRVKNWISNTSSTQVIPIITPADALTIKGFGNNIYGKPALAYLALKDLLGDAAFKKCLHEYMNRWHGKHPIPWDFFNTVNHVSGKNLNWFWNKWFFEPSYIDLSLVQVKATGRQYSITIANTGGMAVPVDIIVQYIDGRADTLHQSPAIWQLNQNKATVTVSALEKPTAIILDGGIFMDANTADNEWHPAIKK